MKNVSEKKIWKTQSIRETKWIVENGWKRKRKIKNKTEEKERKTFFFFLRNYKNDCCHCSLSEFHSNIKLILSFGMKFAFVSFHFIVLIFVRSWNEFGFGFGFGFELESEEEKKKKRTKKPLLINISTVYMFEEDNTQKSVCARCAHFSENKSLRNSWKIHRVVKTLFFFLDDLKNERRRWNKQKKWKIKEHKTNISVSDLRC